MEGRRGAPQCLRKAPARAPVPSQESRSGADPSHGGEGLTFTHQRGHLGRGLCLSGCRVTPSLASAGRTLLLQPPSAPTLGRAARTPSSHVLSGHLPGGVVRGLTSILGPPLRPPPRQCYQKWLPSGRLVVGLCDLARHCGICPSMYLGGGLTCTSSLVKSGDQHTGWSQEGRFVLGTWLEAQLCPSWHPALALGLSSHLCPFRAVACTVPPVPFSLAVKSPSPWVSWRAYECPMGF